MARKRSAPSTPFGEMLRKYRLSAGLSQAALSGRAGLSTSLIALLELGKRQPRRDKVVAIAEALKLNSKAREKLLLRAGHAPLAGSSATSATTSSPLNKAVDELMKDPRLTPKQKLIAESLLQAFAVWLRNELARGTLDLSLPGMKSKR